MKKKLILWIFLFCCSLASCTVPFLLSPSQQDSEAVAAQKATIIMQISMTAESKLATKQVPLTPTILPSATIQCAYVWALVPDIELANQMSEKLSQPVLKLLQLSASWYGENCLNTGTNEVINFSPMNLEITGMFFPAEEQTDEWKGTQINRFMKELLPAVDGTSGIAQYPLLIHIVFQQDQQLEYLNFTRDAYEKLVQGGGSTAEVLYQALKP